MGSSLVGMSNLMSGAMSASSPAKPTLRQRLQKGLGKVDLDKLSKDAGEGAAVSDNNAALMSGGPAIIPNQFGSAMPSYDTGTPLISEDQIAQLHKGEAVVPAEENPNNPDNQKSLLGSAMPEKREEETLIPISKGARFTNPQPTQVDVSNTNVGPKKAGTIYARNEQPKFQEAPVATPDPLVIANNAKKVEAGSKGDLIGLGSALINERHALPKYAGPGANKVGEGELIPQKQLSKDERLYNYQAEKEAAQQRLNDALKSGDHEEVLRARQAMFDVEQQKPHFGLGKVLHGLSEVGQAVGGMYVPEVLANIPGTELHRKYEQAGIEKGLEQESLMGARNAEKATNYEFKTDDQGNMYRLDKTGKNPPQLVTFDNAGKMQSQPVPGGQLPLVTRPIATPTAPTASTSPLGQVAIPTAGPTFGAKPEKLPVGDAGVSRMNDQLNVLAQSLKTSGIPQSDIDAFLNAYKVDARTATGEADKRLQEAKAAAQLTGSSFATKVQRDTTNQQHADAQAALNQQREFQRNEEEQRDIDRSYQYQQTRLDKLRTPVDQISSRLGRLQDTLDQHNMQADALVAPELLSVMSGGQGSGLRMNEAEIARIVGGRTQWENLKAAANKWSADPSTARSITEEQDRQIRALVKTVSDKIHKKQQILTDAASNLLGAGVDTKDAASVKRAQRQAVSDVQERLDRVDNNKVKLRAPDGTTKTVDADQAQHYIDHGAKEVE